MDSFSTESDLGSGQGSGEPVPEQTFHIYILSFAYGALILLVIVHLVWRWQWRRVELSKFKSRYPGDKSFYCKTIRKRLQEDFSRIQALHASPKAKLVNTKYEPSQFGTCSAGSTVPAHWYRMKKFDAAADFVSQNATLFKDNGQSTSTPPSQETHSLPLPAFVSVLRQAGYIQHMEDTPNVDGDGIVRSGDVAEMCCEMYNTARYKDGIFKESHWQEFQSLLTQLQTQLPERSSEGHTEVKGRPVTRSNLSEPRPPRLHSRATESVVSRGSEIYVGYGKHDPLKFRTSNDPLIAASLASNDAFESATLFSPPPSVPTQTSLKVQPGSLSGRVSPSKIRGKKPSPLELSPLVKDSDSSESLTGIASGGKTSGRSSSLAYPETPV